MSSPIDRVNDLDPVLQYAPRWARDGSAAATVQAVPAQPDIAQATLDKRRTFSGDRAAQELFRQLRLNPTAVPEPISDEPMSFRPFLVRLGAVVATAAAIAALIVVLPGTNKSAQAPRPAAISSAQAFATHPVKLARLDATNKVEDRLPSETNMQISTSGTSQDAIPRAQEAVAVTAYVTQQDGAAPATAKPALPVQPLSPVPQETAPAEAVHTAVNEPSDAQQQPVRNEHALDAEQIATLLAQAKPLIQTGDLAAARVLLQRAAEAGNADAALALGGTFDPAVIQQLGALGIMPDAARARQWYERAAALGSEAASKKLADLAQASR